MSLRAPRPLFMALLAALAGSCPAVPSAPGPFDVVLVEAGSDKPLRDLRVTLSGRWVHTDASGVATFPGLPPGNHRLRVAAIDFDELVREVALGQGVRAPLRLELTRVQEVELAGLVRARGSPRPVVGATLDLKPRNIAAAHRGTARVASDLEGGFRIPGLPVGDYQISLTAPGMLPFERTLTLAQGDGPREFELVPVTRPASLSVEVRGPGGAGLAGARVVLAATGDAGLLAEATSDASGRAVLAPFRLGARAGHEGAGEPPIGLGRATLRVEAPGFAPVRRAVDLAEAGVEAVTLHPQAVLVEPEPDPGPGRPLWVVSGQPVRLGLETPGDVDELAFRLASPGEVTVRVVRTPLELWVKVREATGREVFSRGQGPAPAAHTMDLPAGEYRVSLEEWGRDHGSAEPVEVVVEVHEVPDPGEPDDDPAQARLVPPGADLRGWIFPSGDVDRFGFPLARPSLVRLVVDPHPCERWFRVLDEDGRERQSWGMGPTGGARDMFLPAGRFVLQVEEWGRNGRSLEPYRMELRSVPDDGVDDPRVAAGKAPTRGRTLALGSAAWSTLMPRGDQDVWALDIPTRGVLRVEGTFPIETWWSLVDARGAQLLSRGYGPGGPHRGDVTVPGPGRVFLILQEWGDNGESPVPYRLRAWFDPQGEVDELHGDARYGHPAPWELPEPLRDTLFPVGDQDAFRVLMDHPGWLRVRYRTPLEAWVRVLGEGGAELLSRGLGAGEHSLDLPVLAGEHEFRFEEWGLNDSSLTGYAFDMRLERADPRERAPLASDPVRPLVLERADAFAYEHPGDVDRYRFEVPGEGTWRVLLALQRETWVHLYDDRTGAEILSRGLGAGEGRLEWKAAGPTRYRLQLEEWGRNEAGPEQSFVMVTAAAERVAAEVVEAANDRLDPTRVVLRRQALKAAERVASLSLDFDLDGVGDLELPAAGEVVHRLPAEGVHRVGVLGRAADGRGAHGWLWIDARGFPAREGLHLAVHAPGEGQVVLEPTPLRAHAFAFDGAPVRALSVAAGGRVLARTHRLPAALELPWETLPAGDVELVVRAEDGRGRSRELRRRVVRSPFLGLSPPDGAVLTSEQVRVSWAAGAFGPAQVRLREQGAEVWRLVEGEHGRRRVVRLPDLELGKTYQFQPLEVGGAEGPVRSLTRVQGVAFGRSRYAASIARDYDQRVGISVRNHRDEPLEVRLSCGEVPPESRLLLGFVGEGSEGAPVRLGPGEEREFRLGLSAQDCMRRHVRVPLRLHSGGALVDEAEVEVAVRLPEVKLEWEDRGPLESGLGRRLSLVNRGDGLTDLAVAADDPGLGLSPQVDHADLPSGGRLDFVVRPRLDEGFQRIEAAVTATALDVTVPRRVEVALPEGQRVYGVDLIGGVDADPAARSDEQLILAARAMAGAYLEPAAVDWGERRDPQDSDGDGKVDRWQVRDALQGILWVGDDTDGDGEVDFVHADIGEDGSFEHSSFRTRGGWEPTNLVEAWLEVGFDLPWSRRSYERHDVDVLFNGRLVGALRQVIPEGNHTFRVPPTALTWDSSGAVGPARVEIVSTHLRGGHYIVGSDFRLTLRLTGSRVHVVAPSLEQARAAVADIEGLALGRPDHAVSSGELELVGEPTVGAAVRLRVPLRNLGAASTSGVTVALERAPPGGKPVELTRLWVETGGLQAATTVELPWVASPGLHQLRVAVDPGHEQDEIDRSNDVAMIAVEVPGDDAPPTLELGTPLEGAVSEDPVVPVMARARDDIGVARVELRVDGGLFAPLAAGPGGGDGFSGRVRLQPGEHTLTLRALDWSGQATELTRAVRVAAAAPQVRILEPQEGAALDARRARVRVEASPGVTGVALRSAGGPWVRLPAGARQGEVPLEFGPLRIEARVVDARGVRAEASVSVRGTRPRSEEEAGAAAAADDPPGAAPAPGRDPAAEDLGDGLLGPASGPLPPEDESGGRPVAAAPPAGGAAPAAAGAASRGSGSRPRPPPGWHPPAVHYPPTDAQPPGLPPPRPDVPDLGEAPPEDGPGAPAGVDPAAPPGEELPPPTETAPTSPVAAAGGSPAPAPRRAQALGGRAGGMVVTRVRKRDAYCTNRPHIEVPFRLPDELKRKDLPRPGTAEYQAMKTRLMTMLRMRGYRMNRFEDMLASLRRHCERLDHGDELPGYLRSFGLVPAPRGNPEELRRWREALKQRTDAWFLRLLSSEDPGLMQEGLKAWSKTLGKFDQAGAAMADASLQSVQAHQKLAEECAETLPMVGDVLDVYAGVMGETALSGERLSALERALRLAAVAGPLALDKLVKHSPAARQVLEGIGEMGEAAGETGIKALAKATGRSPDEIRRGMAGVGEWLTRERSLVGDGLQKQTKVAGEAFDRSADGALDAARRQQDEVAARELLERVRKADPSSPDLEAAVRELQQNKTAQALINRDGLDALGDARRLEAGELDQLRRKAKGEVEGWYQVADQGVKKDLTTVLDPKASKESLEAMGRQLGLGDAGVKRLRTQVEESLEKSGLRWDDVEIDTLNITNRRPGTRTSFGRDRDVAFVVRSKDGKILKQLDHDSTEALYRRNFYQAAEKKPPPLRPDGTPDLDELKRHAEGYDQTVTSDRHPEAYNTGEVALDDFLDKGRQATITRLDDVRDTVVYKSEHWFRQAVEAGGDPVLRSRHMAEGMRQATKQWNDLVLSRVRQYGLDATRHVPPRLAEGMRLFDDVARGALSPAKAEFMLQRIGLDPSRTVADMGTFLVGLEKTAGATFRRAKTTELVTFLHKLPDRGGAAWTERGLGAVNNALSRGYLSPTQFQKLRREILDGQVAARRRQPGGQWVPGFVSWLSQARQRRLISAEEQEAYRRAAEAG